MGEYSDLKLTTVKGGPELAIYLDSKTTFQPGDTVTGYVSRQEHVVAPNGKIEISLVGRTAVINKERRNNGNGTTTYKYRSKFVLFEEAERIFDGPLHIPPTSPEPQTWPFCITIPTHVSPSTSNIARKRPDRSFLPIDPYSLASTPLPVSFCINAGSYSDELDAFVEYYLTATLTEEHVSKSPKTKHAILPLTISPPPSPPILDFQPLRHLIPRFIVRSQRLLPGRGGSSAKLTTHEHISKFFSRSSVPHLAFTVDVALPTVLQFGSAIPLWVRCVPDAARSSEQLVGVTLEHGTVKVVGCKVRIMAVADTRFDYEDTTSYEGKEFERKSYVEVDFMDYARKVDEAVVVPCRWGEGEGEGQGGGKGGDGSQASSTAGGGGRWRSKEEEARFASGGKGDEDSDRVYAGPSGSGGGSSSGGKDRLQETLAGFHRSGGFVDIGEKLQLRLQQDHFEYVLFGFARKAHLGMVMAPDFTTFNLAVKYKLKWELTLDIVGEKEKAHAEHGVTLVPGWT